MGVEIRAITEDEFEPALHSLESAFSGGLSDDDLRQERLVAETDRWHAAFEDGRIVGGAAAASYRMTVPGGGQVATAGVTSVGVQPTHGRVAFGSFRKQLEGPDVDLLCPWNEGRYAIATAPGGASCERTTASAQIACTATDLGAVYLGGTGFRRLHRAGRVQELTPGAMALADSLFTIDPAPWCAFGF